MERVKTIIMGAAGRDFHNFNVFFRNNEMFEVIAFTATQLPNIDKRTYPPELSGHLYPEGIQIISEEDMAKLIIEYDVSNVVLAYSDLSHVDVMHKASQVLACGADFMLLGTNSTMLEAKVPVVSICAVRTGCGKSQTTRKVCEILQNKGKKLAVVRHPMPYGNLAEQVVQRFATLEDLDKHNCTIEEREEYEPHIVRGNIVYAGVDYEKILRQAEKEADIIVWDGGNNDFSFYKPDLQIVVVDPHRPNHELQYYPGETNFRMADVIVINKINTAKAEDVQVVENNIKEVAPKAMVIKAASPITVDDPSLIKGKRVAVVEDGPTVTHGGMAFGAGRIAAEIFGAAEIIDPRPSAVGSIKDTFDENEHLVDVIPAMGYSYEQIRELEKTINSIDCDVVVSGTPIDLSMIIQPKKPIIRVRYELKEMDKPTLEDALMNF